MDPLEAFYSEVNDRHGLSTALAPLHSFCLVQSLSLSLSLSLRSIIKMHYRSSSVSYVSILQNLSIVIYCLFYDIIISYLLLQYFSVSLGNRL
jgi:hypothetical protein